MAVVVEYRITHKNRVLTFSNLDAFSNANRSREVSAMGYGLPMSKAESCALAALRACGGRRSVVNGVVYEIIIDGKAPRNCHV